MQWLVTGGCGFIGGHLIERLCTDAGARVRVLDDLSVGTRSDLERVARVVDPGRAVPGDVELVVGDVRDPELVQQVSMDCDAIVHLAARTGVLPSIEDPRGDFAVNVLGTLNVLEAARLNRVARVILASSGAPIGDQPAPFHEDMPVRPISPYGASKACGEAYARAYAASFGLGTVALRFSNVYGPRSDRKGSVVARFVSQALAGETLHIYGDGSQTRDFLYVEDLCQAIVDAARANLRGELLQIASGQETSLNALLGVLLPILRDQAGLDCQVVREDFRQGEIRRNFARVDRAQRLLCWEASTSLAQGLERTVRWFVNRTQPSRT
ncbi:MAG: NAD-dependent epimerase/dehydratase family protein [Pseudomonadota bacterium]